VGIYLLWWQTLVLVSLTCFADAIGLLPARASLGWPRFQRLSRALRIRLCWTTDRKRANSGTEAQSTSASVSSSMGDASCDGARHSINPSGRTRIAPVSKRTRTCTGYFVPERDSELRATLRGLLFPARSMLRTERPEIDRMIPRRQIAPALAQIGKFSAMIYGFSTAYSEGRKIFQEPEITLHCYISGIL
jgi:hypothetical protein